MTSFPIRRPVSQPRPLSELARAVGAPAPEEDRMIQGIRSLGRAGPGELGFLASRGFLSDLPSSRAEALLVARSIESEVADSRPRLIVEDAHRALAILLDLLNPEVFREPEIHPTAVLGRGVQIGEGVRIAPYAVIEEGASLEDGASIGAHTVVGAGARIGKDAFLHPHVVVYPGVEIGERVVLHAGVAAGVDGFGYAPDGNGVRKIPHVGACVLEANVEVGANATIDRGSIGETRVMEGAKLDNLVHLAHNVTIGRFALLAAQVGIAGSSRLGTGVQCGGQSGVGNGITVGDGARLGAQTGVVRDVPPGETVMGFPGRPRAEFLRGMAAQGRVPGLLARVQRLEALLGGGGAQGE